MTDENFEFYIKGKITIGYLIENCNPLYMLKSYYKKDDCGLLIYNGDINNNTKNQKSNKEISDLDDMVK